MSRNIVQKSSLKFSVPDIDIELGQTMCRARVDTDSDSIDCSVDVMVVGEGGSSYGHRYNLKLFWFAVANIFLVTKGYFNIKL